MRCFINKNLLIVGAGAHSPYGYPTGHELTKRLCKINSTLQNSFSKSRIESWVFGYGVSYNDDKEKSEDIEILKKTFNLFLIRNNKGIIYNNATFTKDEIHAYYESFNEYINKFSLSGTMSIDDYLVYKINEDEIFILKTLLYITLSYYRNKIDLSSRYETWIEALLKKFFNDDNLKDNTKINFPRIITFNYDDLLETKIVNHLQYKYDNLNLDSEKILHSLPIQHVYGKLKRQDFGSEKVPKFELNCYENILTIGKERTELLNKQIESWAEEAGKVFFLGFGFDMQNMDIIFRKRMTIVREIDALSTFISGNKWDLARWKSYCKKYKINLKNNDTKLDLTDIVNILSDM